MRTRVLRAWLVACVLGVLAIASAQAADLRWPSKSFNASVSDKRLPDFLRELAASQGATAVMDPKVEGTSSGKVTESAQHVLRCGCAMFGLTYYFDGSLLYIDVASVARSEVMPIARGAGMRLRDSLDGCRCRIPAIGSPSTMQRAR